MNYFQCEGVFEVGKEYTITGEVFTHIAQARRVKPGEKVTVQDESLKRFMAEIVTVEKRELIVHIIEEIPTPPEPAHFITLIQAMISEQNVDLILQKTTELGVSHIVLFHADHSPHTLNKERLAHKTERWQKILVAACEQSGRARAPRLTIAASLSDAITYTRGTLVMLEHGAVALDSTHADTTLLVGPEGGFSQEEITLAKEKGAALASLGPYTLRAETAAIVGVGKIP